MRNNGSILALLRDLLCGGLIGAGAILPGVSGGVLAIIFGIYEPLMELITNPRRGLRQHGGRFVPVILGMGIGFLAFAKGLLVFFHLSYTVAVWAFIGLILGTMPALFREAGARGRGARGWGSMALCGVLMFAALYYIGHVAAIQVTPNFWWHCFCGVLLGVGIIIPGLSTSGVLMAMGLYEPMLEALAVLNWSVLLVYGASLALTVLLLARWVRWMFQKCYTVARHGIIGIVAASTLTIIPLEYSNTGEIVLSAICCAAGFAMAFAMERLDREIKRET